MMTSTKSRIALILSLAALLLFVAFLTLPNTPAGSVKARPMGRTSVEGVWGLAPINYTAYGNQTLTPTGSLYLLAPTTTLTVSLATGDALPGDVVILMSTVATQTIITDTGATIGGGNLTLSNTYVVGFIFDGTAWVQDRAVAANE